MPEKSQEENCLCRANAYPCVLNPAKAVALRVLGDTGAAEDVLKEVFLQLWRNPDAFDSARGSLGAWLAVITRNRAIDALRRPPETDIEDVIVSVAPDLAENADRSRAVKKFAACWACRLRSAARWRTMLRVSLL